MRVETWESEGKLFLKSSLITLLTAVFLVASFLTSVFLFVALVISLFHTNLLSALQLTTSKLSPTFERRIIYALRAAHSSVFTVLMPGIIISWGFRLRAGTISRVELFADVILIALAVWWTFMMITITLRHRKAVQEDEAVLTVKSMTFREKVAKGIIKKDENRKIEPPQRLR